jgi:hypothetical protein
LKRYLIEDTSFWRGTTGGRHHIPHFLLNDLTRFWRTMAVDFAYKLRSRQGKGGVIRNLKLRMSRKLIFVAGLLACFRCHLDFDDAQRDSIYAAPDQSVVLDHVESVFRSSPLDIIAVFLPRFPHLANASANLFGSYDQFLGMLSNAETRRHLEADPAPGDPISVSAFGASRNFRNALLEIFFDDRSGLGELTRRYGIF